MQVIETRVNELLLLKGELELRRDVEILKSPAAMKNKPTAFPPGPKAQSLGGPYVPLVVVTGRLDG